MYLSILGEDGEAGDSGSDGAAAPSAYVAAQDGGIGEAGTAGEGVTASPAALDFNPAEGAEIVLTAGSGGNGGAGGLGGNGTSVWVDDDSFDHAGVTYVTHRTGYASANGHGAVGSAGAGGGDASLSIDNAAMTVLIATVTAGAGGLGGAGGNGGVGYQSHGYSRTQTLSYPGGTYQLTEERAGTVGGLGGQGGAGGAGGNASIVVSGATFSGANLTAVALSHAPGTVGGGVGGHGGGEGLFPSHTAVAGGDGGKGGRGGDGGDATLAVTDSTLDFGGIYSFVARAGNATEGGRGGNAGKGYFDAQFRTLDNGDAGRGGDGGDGGDASIIFTGNTIAGTGSLDLSFELTGGARGRFGYGGNGSRFGNEGAHGAAGTTSFAFSNNNFDGGGGDFNLTLRNIVSTGETWYDVVNDFQHLGEVVVNLTTGLLTVDGQVNTITNVVNVHLDIRDGRFVDLAPVSSVIGNSGDNVLTSSAGRIILDGADGNDRLDGGAGADTLRGGLGNDTFYVDHVDDEVIERPGEGKDTIIAQVSYRLLGIFAETLILTGSALSARGNNMGNHLFGTAGDNWLDGWIGNDTMTGGAGNDYYYVDSPGDRVVELSGEGDFDVIYASCSYSLEGLLQVESLSLRDEGGEINATGNSLDNLLSGNRSRNVFTGGAGNDTYHVGAGDRVIEASGEGIDFVSSNASFSLVGTYVENLDLWGDGTATGNSLANVLTGRNGDNVLDGGLNNDTMIGGFGDDTYYVQSAGDKVVEAGGDGNDSVYASVSYSLNGTFVEALYLTGAAAINGTGNNANQYMAGNDAANILMGLGGNDRLYGGLGADTLMGGTGDDTYSVSDMEETIVELASEGTDLVQTYVTVTLSANVENLAIITSEAANGTGNALNNVITGFTGKNILNGMGGADTLTGYWGADVFLFEADSGLDTITDFKRGERDIINVNAYTDGVVDTGLVTQSGANVLITLSAGNIITVKSAVVADVLAQMVW